MERDQAMKFMHDLLRLMSQKKGSDLFITAGFPPAIKIDGKITPVSNQVLTSQHTAELARSIMNDRQASEFEATKECNFAISPAGIGRFRVNTLVQQGRVGVVCRTINMSIPTLDELLLPPVLKDLAMTKRGLIIFVGGTGTAKTTSLAALVDYRNENSYGHIITIEDPIEYKYQCKKSLIHQREVGEDVGSFADALRSALREDPDVILLGELRDSETIRLALTAAETGHLVFGTVHAPSVPGIVDRLYGMLQGVSDAPARFSTTTFWPRWRPASSASSRIVRSVAPPAGQGTHSVIGRSGKRVSAPAPEAAPPGCARAASAATGPAATAAASARSSCRRCGACGSLLIAIPSAPSSSCRRSGRWSWPARAAPP